MESIPLNLLPSSGASSFPSSPYSVSRCESPLPASDMDSPSSPAAALASLVTSHPSHPIPSPRLLHRSVSDAHDSTPAPSALDFLRDPTTIIAERQDAKRKRNSITNAYFAGDRLI